MKVENISIRQAFRFYMFLLTVFAFVIILTVSYAHVTNSEYDQAEASVRSEVNYLCLQLESLKQRADAFATIVDVADVDTYELVSQVPDEYLLLSDHVGNLLDGYTLAETGTVAILSQETVLASDDERLTVGDNIRELLGDEVYNAINATIDSSTFQKITLRGALANPSGKSEDAYLMAGRQDNYTVVIIETESRVFRNRGAVIGREVAMSFSIIALVLFVVDLMLNNIIARGVDKTNEALERITEGDLDVRVGELRTREFRSLSAGINTTVDALQGWIAEAETRMDAELATAKAIQESALPRTFPPYPDITKFDIYASMNAAREVGGDFYDYFLVGDDCNAVSGKLGFVVADVSGKGVPAALFMMQTKALLHDYVASGMELGEAVSEVNRQLCNGNDEGMFVTAWVGLLDYGTGHLQYVNAGHNPPLLWNRAEGWHWMRRKSGPMLGLFDLDYTAHDVDCEAGDTLLLYTDGVTEAFDVNERLYGEQRLLAVAEKNYLQHPRELLESVRASVAAYAQGAEQSDDITILTLEVGVPPEVTMTLEVPAKIDELDHVNDFLHAELDRRLCPKRVQNQLDIVVEELFVNVCRYAYPQATPADPGVVRIQRTYSHDSSSITVDIIDDGIAFDPLAKPDPLSFANVDDLTIGGLGIFMARKLVDEMRYERIDNSNVVTVVKTW